MYRSLFCLFGLLPLAAAPGDPPALVARPGVRETLVNPQCSHCRDEAKRRGEDLRADERVLCWIRGYSDGGAIPYRFFLNKYPVISDTYGVFVHDPDAGFARGFAPSLDFTFYGWRNGVMVMKHKDGTLYSCLSGVAFAGPKKGTRLKAVPTLVSTWGEWLKRYPQAVAYQMFDKYQAVEAPAKPTEESQKSRRPVDKRLPADTMVLGVWDGKEARAYVLPRPSPGIKHTTATYKGKPARVYVLPDNLRTWMHAEGDRVILWEGATQTAAAYRLVASPPAKAPGKARRITLEASDAGAGWRDRETGSQWDIAGRAVGGALKGWTLEWLDGTQVRWFAWAAEYPQTTIHGK